MSAYVVFTKEKTLDPSELAIYQRQVPSTLEPFDARRLVTNGPLEVLEGAPVEGVVITEFPTMEAAKAWYDSPAYRDARVHRQKVRSIDACSSREFRSPQEVLCAVFRRLRQRTE